LPTNLGVDRSAQVEKRFSEQLISQACIHATRRGGQEFGASDVDEAFRSLTSPRRRPFIVDVGAELGLFLSGIVAGYSISIASGGSQNLTQGVVMGVFAILVALFSATLKHTDF
jgi:hypothetical protein